MDTIEIQEKIQKLFQRGAVFDQVSTDLATTSNNIRTVKFQIDALTNQAQQQMYEEVFGKTPKPTVEEKKHLVKKFLLAMPSYQEARQQLLRHENKKSMLQFQQESLKDEIESLRNVLALAKSEYDRDAARFQVQAAQIQAANTQAQISLQRSQQAQPQHIN